MVEICLTYPSSHMRVGDRSIAYLYEEESVIKMLSFLLILSLSHVFVKKILNFDNFSQGKIGGCEVVTFCPGISVFLLRIPRLFSGWYRHSYLNCADILFVHSISALQNPTCVLKG